MQEEARKCILHGFTCCKLAAQVYVNSLEPLAFLLVVESKIYSCVQSTQH